MLGWIGAWLLVEPLFAGCCLPETPARQFNASQAVVEAEVVSAEPFFSETGAILGGESGTHAEGGDESDNDHAPSIDTCAALS